MMWSLMSDILINVSVSCEVMRDVSGFSHQMLASSTVQPVIISKKSKHVLTCACARTHTPYSLFFFFSFSSFLPSPSPSF